MTTATRRRPPRGQIATRRQKRPAIRVRVLIELPGFARESLEVRNHARDLVRELVRGRLPGAAVQQRADQGITIVTDYHGPALNAGPLTAASWLTFTLDECIPEDSPLAELLAGGIVSVSTKRVAR